MKFESCWMGIDLGTSSLKTTLVDLHGTLLASAAREYRIDTPQPGWAEQDPQVWYTAATETIRSVLQQTNAAPSQVRAVGISGQMHTTVCLDARHELVRPAILWADQRSSSQVRRVYEQIGAEKLGKWTGNPLAVGFMLATWLWLQENEPETFRKTRLLLLPKDYLRFCLTGEIGSEASDAASTLLFNPFERAWSLDLLHALGIDPVLLPPIHESAEIAGRVTPAAAADTGLPSGVPVVFGGSDQALQALGNGIVEPGLLSSTIGTGGQLFAPQAKARYDSGLRLHLFCHAAPQVWHLESAMLSAGLSLKWLRDNLFEGTGYQQLADEAQKTTPGAEGLYFLPHLAGERTPHMDPQARGTFHGLTLRHTKAHLTRAVMEGVVMTMKQGFDLMLALGTRADKVVASGGGTRHPLWLQLQADIFNRPIYQTRTVEAAACGAAFLAAVGIGDYPTIQAACQEMVHWSDQVVNPDQQRVELYARVYPVFEQIYPALNRLHI